MRERPKDPSPVFLLFELFEANAAKAIRSKAAHVAGLHRVLDAAIEGGMRWQEGDAKLVVEHFGWERGQYRFRIAERAYSAAIEHGNVSAAKSIEEHLWRDPWFWPLRSRTGTTSSEGGARVAEGSQVWYGDERTDPPTWWSVTSVDDERLVLCLYEDDNPYKGHVYHAGKHHKVKSYNAETGRMVLERVAVDWATASRERERHPIRKVKLTRDMLRALQPVTPAEPDPPSVRS